jgi:hypothetical protein
MYCEQCMIDLNEFFKTISPVCRIDVAKGFTLKNDILDYMKLTIEEYELLMLVKCIILIFVEWYTTNICLLHTYSKIHKSYIILMYCNVCI